MAELSSQDLRSNGEWSGQTRVNIHEERGGGRLVTGILSSWHSIQRSSWKYPKKLSSKSQPHLAARGNEKQEQRNLPVPRWVCTQALCMKWGSGTLCSYQFCSEGSGNQLCLNSAGYVQRLPRLGKESWRTKAAGPPRSEPFTVRSFCNQTHWAVGHYNLTTSFYKLFVLQNKRAKDHQPAGGFSTWKTGANTNIRGSWRWQRQCKKPKK